MKRSLVVEKGNPRNARALRCDPAGTAAGQPGFFGCFGFFGSLRCLSRLPIAVSGLKVRLPRDSRGGVIPI
jgi:hypothetical protein